MAEMILKCNKTGKILWSTKEAQRHAEEIGSQDFSEIDPKQIIWVDSDTGRKAFFSEDELARFRERTRQPDFKVDQCTVEEYGKRLAEHLEKFGNHRRIVEYAKKTVMDALIEVKGISIVKAEKACWFTRNGNVAACEAWLEEHKDDPDINEPIRELPEADPEHPGLKGDAMQVDSEGAAGTAGVTDSSATENPAFVKEKVKAELRDELLGMGFPLIRVEKALYFSDNAGIPNAVQWLTDHEKDADIDAALSVEQPVVPTKPKLSPEEAEKAAMEMQARLKRERDEREKQEAIDKERARIESQKMMRETQAQLEEEQLKRDRLERDRLKKEHEEHAAQLKEQLRLDYIARFGCEPPPEEQVEKDDLTKKSSKDQMIYWINAIRKTHKDDPRLKTCLNTLKVYAGNAQKNPTDLKFLRIKKENKAFQERVAWCNEALEMLQAIGFKDSDEFYAIQSSCCDGWLMGQAIKFLELTVSRI